MSARSEFGEYVVYVDESADHGLKSIDPEYPMFVLAFCLFRVEDYISHVVPSIQRLKFDFFGHDMVVLHEVDIRKSRPPFDILLNASVRDRFLAELSRIIEAASMTLIASCIKKYELAERRGLDSNPYHIALEFGLERIFYELQSRNQAGRLTHIIFEQRGRDEDADLELEFRRILDRTKLAGMAETLRFCCASKFANSAGLQLADMVARPIGRHLLEPDQPNRAFEVLRKKLRTSSRGDYRGWGLKCYP